MPTKREAEELLMIEEADAWSSPRGDPRPDGNRYSEVEPWAWARLMQRQRAIRPRRASSVRRPPDGELGDAAGAARVPSIAADAPAGPRVPPPPQVAQLSGARGSRRGRERAS